MDKTYWLRRICCFAQKVIPHLVKPSTVVCQLLWIGVHIRNHLLTRTASRTAQNAHGGQGGENGYDERDVVRVGGQHVFVEEEQRGAALQPGPNNISSYLGALSEAHPEHTMTGPEASLVDNT